MNEFVRLHFDLHVVVCVCGNCSADWECLVKLLVKNRVAVSCLKITFKIEIR